MRASWVAVGLAVVSLVSLGLAPAAADAHRPATRGERRAIDAKLPRDLRTSRCSRVVVSTVDRDFAAATPRAGRGCNKLGGNGYFLLERQGRAWAVDYTQSLDIACSQAETEETPPVAVLRDLGVCQGR